MWGSISGCAKCAAPCAEEVEVEREDHEEEEGAPVAVTPCDDATALDAGREMASPTRRRMGCMGCDTGSAAVV